MSKVTISLEIRDDRLFFLLSLFSHLTIIVSDYSLSSGYDEMFLLLEEEASKDRERERERAMNNQSSFFPYEEREKKKNAPHRQ